MHIVFSFRAKHTQLKLAMAFLFVVTLACGCLLDGSGTAVLDADFQAVPRLFCEGDIRETTVSWNYEPQLTDCTDSPALTSCDPITEYFFGCPEPAPRCKEVSLASTDGSHDTSIGADELAGSRDYLISVPTIFSLTHPRTSREIADSVSVGFYNGIPDDDVSEDSFTIEVTCSGSQPLDLQEFYDSCILIAQVCNRNEFDIMVNWDSNISPSPVRLAPRECLPLNIPPERISAFEVDRLGQRVSCTSTGPGDVVLPPGEEPIIDLDDIVLGIQKGGCGIFDEGLGECLFTSSDPLVIASEALAPVDEAPTATVTDIPAIVPLSYPIKEDTLCSEGPGIQYNVISSVTKGTEVDLIGIGATQGWWVINNPRFNLPCWIPETAIDVSPALDLPSLEVFEAPPLPTATFTPAPTATLTPVPPTNTLVPVKPNTPSGLSATETACNTTDGYVVSLTWSDNSDNEDGFRVYRDGNLIATLGANATQYTDNPPASGPYSYQVEAYNAAGAALSNSAQEDGCIF